MIFGILFYGCEHLNAKFTFLMKTFSFSTRIGFFVRFEKVLENSFKVLFLVICTGKSLLEALIFASTNPQYDERLFIVQYMKIPSSENGENCF